MEMQIKIVSYHFMSIGKLKLQRKDKPSVGEDVVWVELSSIVEFTLENSLGFC